jgi:diacylglycerol kinase family enzyme
MLACPDASATDGLAHLTSIEGVGRLGILRHLTQKSGGSADRPEVRRATGTTYEIHTPGLALWGDGEPVAESPLTIRLIPAAINIAGHGAVGND